MPDPDDSLSSEVDDLTAAAVEALQGLTASDGGEPQAGRLLSVYHAAAAVLATFDKQTLVPLRGVSAVEGEFADSNQEDLLADCRLVLDSAGRERWALNLDVRRTVLQKLGGASIIERAIATNAASRPTNDPAQEMFELYLREEAPAVLEQTSRQISGTLQVVEWLDGLDLLIKKLPGKSAVRERNEFLALIQPFYDIAGEYFAGRVAEMGQLREYAGVMAPGTFGARIRRLKEVIFDLKEKPPLLIWGPGGRGKSSLVSRFIWEHATLPKTERFAWAYLDFNRPGLLAEEPLTLLIEALRQLGTQYPHAREHCERLRHSWMQELADRPAEFRRYMGKSIAPEDSARATTFSGPDEHARAAYDFAGLLSGCRLDLDPYLLVLDTFEEVQYRSEVVVKSLWQFLEVFQRYVPRLRTIIAGRSRLPESWSLPRTEMELGDFDELAALTFLRKKGISDPGVARKVFDLAGGNPLSLRLAAETWARGNPHNLEPSRARKLFSFFVKDNAIQAQLFGRILDHIHDPDVRKLAFPGMVLRRITPEIIQYVLAGPCGVDVPDSRVAERLFGELSRELALVKVEGGALVHRADVRHLVVDLLREAHPVKVRDVEESAVRYYTARTDRPDLEPANRLVERAEEIYHRLALKQPLDVIETRWLAGVEPHLFCAPEELAAHERVWLAARVGRTLTAEERRLADLDAWERDSLRLAGTLMGKGADGEALAALEQRGERLPGSPLYSLEAEILEKLDQWDRLERVVADGIKSADEAGSRDLATDLRIRGARAEIRAGSLAAARSKLEEAAMLAGDGLTLRAIEVGLHCLALLRAEVRGGANTPESVAAVAAVKAELKKQFDLLDNAEVREQTALMAWLAAEMAQTAPEVVGRVARLTGLDTSSPGRLRALARQIALFDSAQPVAGMLANEAGAPGAPTLTERWTQLILTTRSPALGKLLADLMASVTPSDELTAAIIEIFRGTARRCLVPTDTLAQAEGQKVREEEIAFSGGLSTPPPTPTPASVRGSFKGSELRQITQALLEAFPNPGALAEMVFHKLNRRLELVSFSPAMQTIAFQLVQLAAREDWIPLLIAAARESNPKNATLQEIASRYGLATQIPDALALQEVLSNSAPVVSSTAWRERLGLIENQICRVELSAPGSEHYGTGFLVGPDLVMTAFHVIAPVLSGGLSSDAVRLRFDYRQLPDGSIIQAGTPHKLAREWLVAASACRDPEHDSPAPAAYSPDPLDYAILRLTRQVGFEPAGGGRAEPGARPRHWLQTSEDKAIPPSHPLAVLQYPEGRPLVLSIGHVLGYNAAHTRVLHDVNTLAGSSGAPCFDSNWNLVGMHLGADVKRGGNFAVPLPNIRHELEQLQLLELLDQKLT